MTNNKQQTAVEQMFQEMLEIQQSGKTLTFDENLALLEKYKQIEKQQHLITWCDSLDAHITSRWSSFQQYWNKPTEGLNNEQR